MIASIAGAIAALIALAGFNASAPQPLFGAALKLSTVATSTFPDGLDIGAGCFAKNGTCLSLSSFSGTLGATNGGTGQSTVTQGDLLYGSAANTWSKLAKDTNSTRYLSNTGSSNNPAWAQVNLANGVTGDLPFANLTQGAALTVLANATNGTADFAALAAASDNQVLRRSGTALAFGAINLASSNAVTGDLPFANLTQGSALSVLGVASNATADVASIAAASDHQVLRRSGTAIAWGAINLAQSAAVTGLLGAVNGGTGVDTSASTGVAVVNSGTWSASSTLGVPRGGTGAATFGQGWIFSAGGTGALAASTSPTVNYLYATSTTASSTFQGITATAINLTGAATSTASNGINITAGCFAKNNTCIGSGAAALTTAVSAYMSTTLNNVSGTTVTFDTETLDVGSNFNTGTNTFTAPATGRYYISVRLDFSSVVDGGRITAAVRVNGTTDIIELNQRIASADNTQSMAFSELVPLNSGDTVIIRADSSDGTNAIAGGNRKTSNLTIYRLD